MRTLFATLVAAGALAMAPFSPTRLAAQTPGKPGAKAAASAKAADITGSYAGTAMVPLGDSTIVVPVSYLFTGAGPTIGGTAMVPGQGTGAISHVVRDGQKLRFRVTAPENKLLEHDGVIAANGSIEGFVNLDNKPVAKFKIAPGTLAAPKGASKPSGAPNKPRGGVF
ncbi:hypothetical protein [Gemmatimonas phototrophica]|uniref:DUF5666 domain-containing protein n=1 Tax=Gemmatimonas phototrophica TaxID=1379270 RepID=A0A143BHG9_9BACT|nr:hypothetical protein [Gemmatimonas phototrophica]AMW04478.1 hypothetical protein GEMMAAP_05740 [Gemmatimonas phototrophica]